KVRKGLGTEDDLLSFLIAALTLLGARADQSDRILQIELGEELADLTDLAPGRASVFRATVSLPTPDGVAYLTRTHPFVEAVAERVLDAALRGDGEASISRCGTSRTGNASR